MNAYSEMMERHQKDYNNFPFMFAFSDKQFIDGMDKWGLDPADDLDKIYSIGAGGYIRKSDSDAFHKMIEKHDKELMAAIAEDTIGNGFIYQMFVTELANHEYGYTGELDETLDELGLTYEEIEKNPALEHGLSKAMSCFH